MYSLLDEDDEDQATPYDSIIDRELNDAKVRNEHNDPIEKMKLEEMLKDQGHSPADASSIANERQQQAEDQQMQDQQDPSNRSPASPAQTPSVILDYTKNGGLDINAMTKALNKSGAVAQAISARKQTPQPPLIAPSQAPVAPPAVPTSPPQSLPQSQQVQNFISDKFDNDPLMQAYNDSEGKIGASQEMARKNSGNNNLAQIFANFSTAGGQKPVDNSDVFKNMAQQNKDFANQPAQAFARRQAVINAIQNRQAGQAIADNTNAYRMASLGIKSNQVANSSTNNQANNATSAKNNQNNNATKLKIAQTPKPGTLPQAPTGPKVGMNTYNNASRSLEAVKALQGVSDIVNGMPTGKFTKNTGVIGKIGSFFGSSDPDVEHARRQIPATAPAIASAMANGNSPTEQQTNDAKSLLPNIDTDEPVVARSKAAALMHKIMIDTEGKVRALEMANDPKAADYRQQLEQLKSNYRSSLMPKAQPSSSPQGAQTSPKLNVGDVFGGYVYMGGDEADQKSWQEVQQ